MDIPGQARVQHLEQELPEQAPPVARPAPRWVPRAHGVHSGSRSWGSAAPALQDCLGDNSQHQPRAILSQSEPGCQGARGWGTVVLRQRTAGGLVARAVWTRAPPSLNTQLCDGDSRGLICGQGAASAEAVGAMLPALPFPLSSRTVYYTSYRQVYTAETRTVLRCCPGWSQQPGAHGCLSGECPRSPVPLADTESPSKRPCVWGRCLPAATERSPTPRACSWWDVPQEQEQRPGPQACHRRL